MSVIKKVLRGAVRSIKRAKEEEAKGRSSSYWIGVAQGYISVYGLVDDVSGVQDRLLKLQDVVNFPVKRRLP